MRMLECLALFFKSSNGAWRVRFLFIFCSNIGLPPESPGFNVYVIVSEGL